MYLKIDWHLNNKQSMLLLLNMHQLTLVKGNLL